MNLLKLYDRKNIQVFLKTQQQSEMQFLQEKKQSPPRIEASAIRGARARRVDSRLLWQLLVGNGQVGGDAVASRFRVAFDALAAVSSRLLIGSAFGIVAS